MSEPVGRAVRVLPDLPALSRAFDYLVPPRWDAQVMVGSRVRVGLGRRVVAGWVIEVDVEPPAGVALRCLSKLSGSGPAPELVDLARWAAWRWAGSQVHFLRTASPDRLVTSLPPPGAGLQGAPQGSEPRLVAVEHPGGSQSGPVGRCGRHARLVEEALSLGLSVLRLAPSLESVEVVDEVLCRTLGPRRSVIVLAPSVNGARQVALRLESRGWPVAILPGEWAGAAAGGRVVVGARAAAWGPGPALAAIVVLDAHDRAYQSEAAPTWSAWRVAAERARRAGVPCLLVSPCPSLEIQAWGTLVTDSRTAERLGWAAVEIVDMRAEDPRCGLYSERLVAMLRAARDEPGGRVVCVLNRTGRARLLACRACGELARCETCQGPMAQPVQGGALKPGVPELGVLECRNCGERRPVICVACGSTSMKALRVGVSRVRDELQALTGRPVEEVSGPAGDRASITDGVPVPAVVVGTEAVLHRLDRAAAVAFLDMDQELLAGRFRAGEDALALLARASRLVGGRGAGGRVLVQTRMPGHEVLASALHADPGRLARAESAMRTQLRLPPASALALVSGSGAASYLSALREADLAGLEVRGPDRGTWLLRAPDHDVLCNALAAAPRPKGRLRLQVDPRQA